MSGFGVDQDAWASSAEVLRSTEEPGKASPTRRGWRIAKRMRKRERGSAGRKMRRIGFGSVALFWSASMSIGQAGVVRGRQYVRDMLQHEISDHVLAA
jgi:hypothetical protein